MIQHILPQLLPILGNVLDKAISDKDDKNKTMASIEQALVANAATLNMEIIKTNQVEAAHKSVWVAGWRPAIGWTLAAGMFFSAIFFPIAIYVERLFGLDIPAPELPTDLLFELTLAMLGMSGIRSFDKLKNLTK